MSTPLPDTVKDDMLHKLVLLEQDKPRVLSNVIAIPSALFAVGVVALFTVHCEDCESLAQKLDNVFGYGIIVLIAITFSLLRFLHFVWAYNKVFNAEHEESGSSRTKCGCRERKPSPTIFRIKIELIGTSTDTVFVQFRCRCCEALVDDRTIYRKGIGHGCEDVGLR